MAWRTFSARGKRKTEVQLPRLETDIRVLMIRKIQPICTCVRRFPYTRMTVKAVRAALLTEKDWKEELLPPEPTLCDLRNQLGY